MLALAGTLPAQNTDALILENNRPFTVIDQISNGAERDALLQIYSARTARERAETAAANAQNWPQAVEQMKEAIQLCGQCAESAHLHRNLGLIYCRTGNAHDGEKELRATLQIDSHDEDAKALALLENVSKPPPY
jgi:hypothetical protein